MVVANVLAHYLYRLAAHRRLCQTLWPLLLIVVLRRRRRQPALKPNRLCIPRLLLALLQPVRVVCDLLHRDLAKQEEGEETRGAEPEHRAPHGRHAVRERDAHLAAQRLGQAADDGDRGVCDLDAGGELGRERGWELRLELVLEDGGGDGDAPCLKTRAKR